PPRSGAGGWGGRTAPRPPHGPSSTWVTATQSTSPAAKPPTPSGCSASTRPRRITRRSPSSASAPRPPPSRTSTCRDGPRGPRALGGDAEGRDGSGRGLAYVIVDGERFNDELLRRGYARLLVIEPNHAHARAMLRDELEAKTAGRGLWREC